MPIGPQLPAGWKPPSDQKGPSSTSSESEDEEKEIKDFWAKQNASTSSASSTLDSENSGMKQDILGLFAPVLIPEESKEKDSPGQETYGPCLPPDFVLEKDSENPSSATDSIDEIGPALPVCSEESFETSDESYENRLARFRKQKFLKELGKQKREEWMTELPAKLQNYGLGPRTFSKRGVESSNDDHSAWTDSPGDKIRKAVEGKCSSDAGRDNFSTKAQEERDRELESRAAQMNKNRTESLVEMHQKKRKADSEAEGEGSSAKERKPFDRERDLQVTRIKAGGLKKMVKSAGELSSKFSHSTCQKYL